MRTTCDWPSKALSTEVGGWWRYHALLRIRWGRHSFWTSVSNIDLDNTRSRVVIFCRGKRAIQVTGNASPAQNPKI